MAATAFAFSLGIIGVGFLRVLPDAGWAAFGLLAAPGLFTNRWGRVAAAGVLGFCYGWLVAGAELGERLPRALDGKVFVATGTVDSLPEAGTRRLRFNLALESLQGPGGPVPGPDRLRLSWYEDFPPLEPGERWRLSVKLNRPHGYFNPGGFDYERWLFREGIDATGYVSDGRAPERLAAPVLAGRLDRWRARLGRQIARAVGGESDETALLRALTVGDRRGLDDADWRILNATGTSHLVAISGLHVGLVAGFGLLLGAGLARLCPPALRRLPARHWGAAVALAAAVAYAALAGFALPTRRALVMVAAGLFALLARRCVRPLPVLALAMTLVLLLDPLAPLGAGFWLSFLAVGALIAVFSGQIGRRRALGDGARAQLVVGLALAVPVAFFFQRLAWAAPAANLVAVPLVGLVAVPLALGGTVLLCLPGVPGAWMLKAAAHVLGAFWQGAQWLAARPEVLQSVAAPGPLALLGSLAGVAWLLAPRGVPGRFLGILLVLPLFTSGDAGPAAGTFRLSVLDVGQGLAAVVRTRDHVLVYDTGPAYRSGFNTAEAVVAPYLLAGADGRLDTLVVSHGDTDHAGGAARLAAELEPARVLAGEGGLPGFGRCRDGQSWRRDGVRFRVLHPPPAMPDRGNDSSCVLAVTGRERRLLLTGDITRVVERRLLAVHRDALDADVLVAPHHGSASSSSRAFIRAVSPAWVVFATGFGNRFGLPRPDVVRRYRDTGAAILDTARSGMVRLEPRADESWRATRWRDAAGHYWTDRPRPRYAARPGGIDPASRGK